MTSHGQIRATLAAGFFLLAMSSSAQMRLGELSVGMTGTVAPGYSATTGNQPGSASHGFTFGGASTLTGSYHSPNFFAFNADLYLNQSRANSDFQSISNSSGIDLNTTIFGGGAFPGSVGYSLAYNSDGNYGVPGVANYVTHGNSDTFSVGWSENISNKPTFSAAFEMGQGKYSVYGANQNGSNSFRSLNLHSSYRLAGLGMGAYYSKGASHALIPDIVTGDSSLSTDSGSDSYGFNASHRLPFAGGISGGFNRSSFSTGFEGTQSSGTIDLLTVQATLHPLETVSFSASASYSDNLSGQLVQQIVAAGGVAPGIDQNQSSNSLDLEGVASWSPSSNAQASFTAERRTQSYLGQDYGVTSYGVSGSYNRQWRRLGTFNSSVSATENADDQTGDNTVGLTATESYAGDVRNWKVNANFSYAQNMQTLLIVYMNSYFNYAVNAHRKWGEFLLGVGASAGRTALTEEAGTESDSQSYNASLGYGRWITTSANYSRAHGEALATGAGLVPVPIPPLVPSDLLALYGGNSYGFSLASTPIKRFTVSASYAKSLSNTAASGITSDNENDQYNALLQYQVRKLNFVSGYARLQQGFSGAGSPPQIVVSYYAGISRWFKFF